MSLYFTIGWQKEKGWKAYHIGLPYPGFWGDQWVLQLGPFLFNFQVNRED